MASELCMNCFSVKGQYEVCPFCGYVELSLIHISNVFRSCPHCKKKNETLSLMVDNVEEDDKTRCV